MWIDRKTRVYIYSEPIDMRWAFERLGSLVREKMKHDLDKGDLYLFLGRNRRRLKALRFDGSGLVLFTKRMEKKNFMVLSELEDRLEITRPELELLIHGSVLRKYLPEGR